MQAELAERLKKFALDAKFSGKGPLSVGLIVTQHARTKGLPLDHGQLVTPAGTQVAGLSMGSVQTVLKRYGITKILSKEAGRTSRGSVLNMQKYVGFLNEMNECGPVDLEAVEAFWIERVREFFAAKPFRIQMDASRSLRTVVRHVLSQAEERQRASSGMQYIGAVMQHLVGAKLDCALGPPHLVHNSASTSDQQSGRAGDFSLGDVAIHVTSTPGEAVISRCADNLSDGLRPVLVTRQMGLPVAEGLAANVGLGERIDIFEIEQFIALNLYEIGRFAAAGRRVAVEDLVKRYNEIVDEFETDPSLRIEIR